MKSLVGQPVFRVGDEQYFWEDAFIGGVLRGEWDALQRETREGQACLRRARDGHPLPADAVAAAAAEFRYARDLVAGQDAMDWLHRWGLGTDEWMDCIRRSVARRLWADDLPRIVEEHAPPDDEVRAAMQSDALCSGRLRALAESLARRAAAYDWLRANDAAFLDDAAATVPAPADLADCPVPDLARERLAERGAVVSGLERALARFAAQVVTPKAVEARVAHHRLDWIRFRTREVSFASEALAREAAFCVREDGLDIAEVAADAHAALHVRDAWLGDMPASLRDRMLAAGAGDLVGPVEREGHHVLIRVDEKRLPDAADPDIRQRAEREVLERALEHAARDRTRWLVSTM